MPTTIYDLPPEMIVRILRECDIRTICRVTGVCKFLALIIDTHYKLLPRRQLKFVAAYSESILIIKGVITPDDKENPSYTCPIEQRGSRLAFTDIEMFRIDMKLCCRVVKAVHLAFIDLEKAYDRVLHELIWMSLQKHGVPEEYVLWIKMLYQEPSSLPVEVGVHQGSVLSPLLFILCVDTITQGYPVAASLVPTGLLYAGDLMLAAETRKERQAKVQLWKDRLQRYGLRLKTEKTIENIECGTKIEHGTICVDGDGLKKVECFKYLGSRIDSTGDILSDTFGRANAAWMKWRTTMGILYGKKMPIRRKSKVYRTVVRTVALYGTECLAATKAAKQVLHTVEMRMLRWSMGVTLRDEVPNEVVRSTFGVAPITTKMREARLRWLGRVCRREEESVTKTALNLNVKGTRPHGRPKTRWLDCVKSDMAELTLNDEKSMDWSSFFRKFHTKVHSLHFTVTVVTTWAVLNIVESLCPNSLKIEFEIKDGPLKISQLCRHRAVQQVTSITLLDSNIYDECLDEIRIPTVHLEGLTQVTGFGLQHILSEWLSGKRVIKLYEITARGYVSPSHLFHNLPFEHVEETDSWTLRRGDEVLSVVANGHKTSTNCRVKAGNEHWSTVLAKSEMLDFREKAAAVTSAFCEDWFHDASSILILGDGNLSFSLAVAECMPDKYITATVLDSETEFAARYPNNHNAERLCQHSNVKLLFSIDATALPQEWAGKYHYIVMNFPHPGGKTNLRKSRQLASAIFRGVSRIMTPETEFYLALAQGQAGVECPSGSPWTTAVPAHAKDSWQALYLAADKGLLLEDVCAFPAGAFAGYSSSGYKSTARGFNNSQGAQRLLFRKSPVLTSLHQVASLERPRGGFHMFRPYFLHDVSFLFLEDVQQGEHIVFDLLHRLTGSAVVNVEEVVELRSMCPEPYLPNRIYRLTWQVVSVAVGKRLCNELQEQLRSEIQKAIRSEHLPLILT
ncbi:hypothetical protein Y032_0206g1991 [Ancylostoma ceylanicum]|uniref:F-box domain-containing protein n=1 Tax=Ancylostoma ceylanicum TaxID=53326 RepID=A0A016SLC0_9BILA|nr:hypothetical protein Y032_0206g1991 [Ancylostoma ceylanicum]